MIYFNSNLLLLHSKIPLIKGAAAKGSIGLSIVF